MIEAFTKAMSDASADPERLMHLACTLSHLGALAGVVRIALMARRTGDEELAGAYERRADLLWESAREKCRAL